MDQLLVSIVVFWSIINSTTCLTGGTDYGSGPYNATIPAGQTRTTFDVPITDNDIVEGDEDFTLTIDPSSLRSNVTVGDPDQTTVTKVDDDSKQLL